MLAAPGLCFTDTEQEARLHLWCLAQQKLPGMVQGGNYTPFPAHSLRGLVRWGWGCAPPTAPLRGSPWPFFHLASLGGSLFTSCEAPVGLLAGLPLDLQFPVGEPAASWC